MKFRAIRFIPPLVLAFAATSAFAQTPPPCAAGQYNLLAPIGTLSGCVDLGTYLKGMFETIIGIGGILAVFRIVLCGIKLMSAGSVSGKNEAKECITNAILGVMLAVGSWLILNTINPLLLIGKPSAGITAPLVTTPLHTAVTQANPTQKGCYFKYKDLQSGDTRFSQSATCSACELSRNEFQADTVNYQILSECYDPTTTAAPPSSTPPPGTSAGSITCPLSGANLCDSKYRVCTNPSCAKFASMASNNAGGAATAELIKAIILQESSCGQQLVGDGGNSCGPMHIQPATANKFLDKCGLTDPVTCGWLTQPGNFDKAICLSSQYLQSLATPCGNNIQDLAAGYNGGGGACATSADCGGDKSCSGGSVRKWECLYDDSAHQICNAGYNTTRNYAMLVHYCTTNPGY